MNEADKRKAREALFDDLSNDKTTPEEAEARARELGLEPITPTLDPALFDPMRETHWTLAMAVSWIAWADLDRVRECLPRWRAQDQDWSWREFIVGDGAGGSTVRAGYLLERTHKGESPLLFLSVCEAVEASEGAPLNSAQRHTINEAQRLLWEKLGSGELTASTVFNGAPHVIPAHEWAFLRAGEHRDRDVLYLDRDSWLGPRYDSDVIVPRDDVLKRWPAPQSTAGAETRAESALRETCKAAQSGAAHWPKSGEWRARATGDFQISGRGAGRVWSAVAEDFPALASPAGKPKARRQARSKPKRGAK